VTERAAATAAAAGVRLTESVHAPCGAKRIALDDPSSSNGPRTWARRAGRWTRLLGGLCLDAIATLRLPTSPRGEVMLVRLDAIGDFVIWQSTARRYRDLYPTQRLVLAANAAWAALAAQLPYWDEVISVDVGRMQTDLRYRFCMLADIRRRRFDTALQPTYSRTLLLGDSVIRASRARRRIGSIGDLTNISAAQKRISDRWYTDLLSAPGDATSEQDRNLQFLRALGWRGDDSSADAATAGYLPAVAELPASLRFDTPYCIVFPGASWTGRQWSPNAFAQLIDSMAREHAHRRIVLCGSAPERALCDQIARLTPIRVANLAGSTSLPEFCEFVRRAEVLVGNETSAVHIAAAVGTPSVCILGGGHFGRFVPYPASVPVMRPDAVYARMPCFGCDWQCHLRREVGEPVPCIAAVTVDAVLAAVRRVSPTGAPAPSVLNGLGHESK
jgi:ADP-heptose:LPS heptosyltransferase